MLNSKKSKISDEYQKSLYSNAQDQIKISENRPLIITFEGHILRKYKDRFSDEINNLKNKNNNFLIGYYYSERVKQEIATGKIVEIMPTIEVCVKIQFNNPENTFKDLIYYFMQVNMVMQKVKKYLATNALNEICTTVYFGVNTDNIKSELLYNYMGEHGYVKNLNRCKYSKINKNYFQAVIITKYEIMFEIEGAILDYSSIEEVIFHILNEIYEFNDEFVGKIE